MNGCESDHPWTVVSAVELKLAGSGHLADPRPCRGRSRRLTVVDPVQLEQACQLGDRVGHRIDKTRGDGLWHQHSVGAQPLQSTILEEGSARSA